VGRRYNRAFSRKEAVKHHALEEIEQTGEKACEGVIEEAQARACSEESCAEAEPRQGVRKAGKACCQARGKEAEGRCQASRKTGSREIAARQDHVRACRCTIRIQDPAATGKAAGEVHGCRPRRGS
jgi:hypothetical protein